MAPALMPGDDVLVEPCDGYSDIGLYAISFDTGTRIRRVSKDPRTGLLSVAADNPAWPSFRAIEPGRLPIVGKVMMLGRRI